MGDADETLEIGVKGVKVPVGFIARTLFPGRVARSEAIAALCASACDKVAKGDQLSPEEQAVFAQVMAPTFKKAERVARIAARADEINASESRLLPAPEEHAAEPTVPSEAFRDRFAAGAELASDDHVEEIWARILAGEVRKPGSFSFKTLSVLRDIGTPTAEAFARLVRFALRDPISGPTVVPDSTSFQRGYESVAINFPTLLDLNDAGLVNTGNATAAPAEGNLLLYMIWYNFVVRIKEVREAGALPFEGLTSHLLTRAGAELATIAVSIPSPDEIEALRSWLWNTNASVSIAPLTDELRDRVSSTETYIVRKGTPEPGEFFKWTRGLVASDGRELVLSADADSEGPG